MADEIRNPQVDQFVAEQIDSVPHLEALLLLWESRPKAWTIEEMARSLYIRSEQAAKILEALVQRNLVQTENGDSQRYTYGSGSEERNQLMQQVEATYRRELVRISSLIHSKATAGVRDFARAFRFTRDKD
jgi:predicted ArsR family transcriptional regulator